jgi:hypothetical protein
VFLFDYGSANDILEVTREQALIEGSAEPGLPPQESGFDPLYANPGPIRRIATETDPGAPANLPRLIFNTPGVVRTLDVAVTPAPVPTH